MSNDDIGHTCLEMFQMSSKAYFSPLVSNLALVVLVPCVISKFAIVGGERSAKRLKTFEYSMTDKLGEAPGRFQQFVQSAAENYQGLERVNKTFLVFYFHVWYP
jgi:hypothetical protein